MQWAETLREQARERQREHGGTASGKRKSAGGSGQARWNGLDHVGAELDVFALLANGSEGARCRWYDRNGCSKERSST
jgi:hypothetical protein